MKLVSYFASFLRIAHGVDWQTQREQKRYIQVWLFFFSFSNCWAREWPFSRLFNAPMYQRIFAIDSTAIAAAPLCAANIYFANKGKHQNLAASHRLFCAFSTRRRYLCISKNDIEWTNIATEWKYSMANESYIFFFLLIVQLTTISLVSVMVRCSHPSTLYRTTVRRPSFFLWLEKVQ